MSTVEIAARRLLAVRLVIGAALLTEGAREATGRNDGALINQWQASTGNKSGDAWCMSWAVDVISTMLAALWPRLGPKAFPLPYSASCDVVRAACRKLGLQRTTPEVGDLFFVMASATDATHVGIVTARIAGGTDPRFRSIEGNTNTAGSRDGDGVYQAVRGGAPDGQRYEFYRWADALPAGPLLA